MKLTLIKGCLGKEKYKTKSIADFVLSNFKLKDQTIVSYFCQHCKNYHVGHDKYLNLKNKVEQKASS